MKLKAERIGDAKAGKEEGMCFRIIDTDTNNPLEKDIAVVYHKPNFEDCERLANIMANSQEMLTTLLYLLNSGELSGFFYAEVKKTILLALGAKEDDVLAMENEYICPECGKEWNDIWDCGYDAVCPYCDTKNVSPETSNYIDQLFHEEGIPAR